MLSFLLSIATMIVEYCPHHRLWHYNPDGNRSEARCKLDLQFLLNSIINDQRTSSWRLSLCKKLEQCPSRNLYHILLYHSDSTQYSRDEEPIIRFRQNDKKSRF